MGRPARRRQRGAVALLMLPFIAALVLWPITANLAIRKAEQKRLDEEVRVMLRGLVPLPRSITSSNHHGPALRKWPRPFLSNEVINHAERH